MSWGCRMGYISINNINKKFLQNGFTCQVCKNSLVVPAIISLHEMPTIMHVRNEIVSDMVMTNIHRGTHWRWVGRWGGGRRGEGYE